MLDDIPPDHTIGSDSAHRQQMDLFIRFNTSLKVEIRGTREWPPTSAGESGDYQRFEWCALVFYSTDI